MRQVLHHLQRRLNRAADASTDVEAGAFGAHPGHDAHILSTLSAIQILVMQDALDRADVDRMVQCASRSSCNGTLILLRSPLPTDC